MSRFSDLLKARLRSPDAAPSSSPTEPLTTASAEQLSSSRESDIYELVHVDSGGQRVFAAAARAASSPVISPVETVQLGSQSHAQLRDLLVTTHGHVSSADVARDWNNEFQTLQELEIETSSQLDVFQEQQAQFELEFRRHVSAVVDVLLVQLALGEEHHELWVYPRDEDGTFHVGGCDFELASDSAFARRVLGGEALPSHKSARNLVRNSRTVLQYVTIAERLGCITSTRTQAPSHVQLMATVHRSGEVVLARAALPIDGPRTLVAGSADHGITFNNSSSKMMSVFKRVAKQLNLQQHKVKASGSAAKPVVCRLSASERGYLGVDKRYYLTHTHRLLPPEVSASTDYPTAGHWRQLRPEFLRLFASRVPISSDAFARAGQVEPADVALHQDDLVAAIAFLHGTVLPVVGQELAGYSRAQLRRHVRSSKDLSAWLHARGANVRHLGVLLALLPPGEARDRAATEILVRSVKAVHRATAAALPWGQRVGHQQSVSLAAQLLEYAMAAPSADPTTDAEVFWLTHVQDAAVAKFGVSLEQSEVHRLRADAGERFVRLLLTALGVRSTGPVVDLLAADNLAALLQPSPLESVRTSCPVFDRHWVDRLLLEARVRRVRMLDELGHTINGVRDQLTDTIGLLSFVMRSQDGHRGPEALEFISMIIETHRLGKGQVYILNECARFLDLLLENGQETLAAARLLVRVLQKSLDIKDDHHTLERLAMLHRYVEDPKEILPLFQRVLAHVQKKYGPDHLQTASALFKVGVLQHRAGMLQDAVANYRRALRIRNEQLGAEHDASVLVVKGLSSALRRMRQWEEARSVCEDLVALVQGKFGEHSVELILPLAALIECIQGGENVDDNELGAALARLFTVCEHAHGLVHDETFDALGALIEHHSEAGAYAELTAPLARVVAAIEETVGPLSPLLADWLLEQGGNLLDLGRADEAQAAVERAVKIRTAVYGPEALTTAHANSDLGEIHRFKGEFERAEALMRRSLQVTRDELGPDHLQTAVAVSNLASVFTDQSRFDEAKALYDEAIATCEAASGRCTETMAVLLNNLALLHKEQGEFDEAERLIGEALEIQRQLHGDDSVAAALSHWSLAVLHHTQAHFDAALPSYRRAVSIYELALGSEHYRTVQAKAMLDKCLQRLPLEDAIAELEDQGLGDLDLTWLQRARKNKPKRKKRKRRLAGYLKSTASSRRKTKRVVKSKQKRRWRV